MKVIYLDFHDGARFCVGSVPDSFDIQSWANSRADSFKILEVRRVSVAEMPQLSGKKEVDATPL